MAHAEVSATMPSVSRSITPTHRHLEISESRAYLEAAEAVYIGTVGADGWLSAMPVRAMVAGQHELWFLNPPSDSALQSTRPGGTPGVCLAVVERAAPRTCRLPPAYVSVVAYGRFHAITDRSAYLWFLRQLRRRQEPPARQVPDVLHPFGAPVTLWKMTIERLVGHCAPGTHGPFVP